ncbi:MAG: hypothetical protein ABL911_05300 [Gallionella sp.]
MDLESKITCPYCNGEGHHEHRTCAKCFGTGEFVKRPTQPGNPDRFSLLKLLLIWAAFFITVLLGVYVLIFLDDLGIKDVVVTASLSGVAWVLILRGLLELYRNSQKPSSDRMTMFNLQSSRLENVVSVVFILLIASQLIYFALLPILRLLG